MIKNTIVARVSAACLILFAAHSAMAQTKAADPGARARDVAMQRLAKDLSHEELAVFNMVAHATVAANLCENLGLNETAVATAVSDAIAATTAKSTDDGKIAHRDLALIGFGVMVGLMLEDGARDEKAFCETATRFASGSESKYLVLARGENEVIYQCGDAKLVASFIGEQASVDFQGKSYQLVQVESGSGAKYEAGEGSSYAMLWSKGDDALLQIGDKDYPECKRQ